jgi:NADH dehydrogenase
LVQLLRAVGPLRAGTDAAKDSPATLGRVVIVGSGFAGVSAAKRFERLALRNIPIDVTLVGSSNFLLFTPMLAEVASGALEPAHISAPVRASVAHTRFRNRTVAAVDTDRKLVELAPGAAPAEWVPYDHLVLAVGSVPHFLGLPGVEDFAMTLKDLHDATALRDHVLEQLEQADSVEPDPAERARMLTFVVAGGGFAGAEAVAELFDLVHGVLPFFPGITPDEPRFVLVHSREHILPELSAALGDYAMQRLRARGIEFRLTARVSGATPVEVRLDDGGTIPTRTFVWTAGNRPSPLVRSIGGEHARGGALATDSCFRVTGLEDVWAIGDCARIPDPGGPDTFYPPTAQHALREGAALADNVASVLRGRTPREFRFRTIGVLVALGHRTAAAEIRGHRFSGFAAWMMWRAIYLAKLPGVEKRVRVLLDWVIDLVLPRDIVVTRSESPTRPERVR